MGEEPKGVRVILLTRGDIARRANVTVAAVDKRRQRHSDFPKPVRRFAQTPVWDGSEVMSWHKKRGLRWE